jgi:sortase A
VVTGHRDTQFRFLKDLAPGDELGLVGPDGARHRYVVMDALVVDERDTSVLAETGEARLTLVTCFPFDAVVPGGPLRYVVRAASPGFQRPLAARPPLPHAYRPGHHDRAPERPARHVLLGRRFVLLFGASSGEIS